MFNNFEDMQTMGKANVDATMKSFEAVTKSTQAIVNEIADYSRRSFENGTKAAEKLIGAKSLDTDRGAERICKGGLRRLRL